MKTLPCVFEIGSEVADATKRSFQAFAQLENELCQ